MPPEPLLLDLGEPRDIAEQVALGPQAVLLRGFARGRGAALIAGIRDIAAVAPFRRMITPGGWQMSVAMTNCGAVGWVTDRSGYRYDAIDPMTGCPWPAMPEAFADLAARAASQAGFRDFQPDACLLNRYVAGARLSLSKNRAPGMWPVS